MLTKLRPRRDPLLRGDLDSGDGLMTSIANLGNDLVVQSDVILVRWLHWDQVHLSSRTHWLVMVSWTDVMLTLHNTKVKNNWLGDLKKTPFVHICISSETEAFTFLFMNI